MRLDQRRKIYEIYLFSYFPVETIYNSNTESSKKGESKLINPPTTEAVRELTCFLSKTLQVCQL